MRWAGVGVIAALAVFFLWLARDARSSKAAERNRKRHLGAGEQAAPDGVRRRRIASRLRSKLEATRAAASLKTLVEASGLRVPWAVALRAWIATAVMLPVAALLLTGSLLAVPPALAIALGLPGIALKLIGGARERHAREQCDDLAADLALFLRCGVPVEDALPLCARGSGPRITQAVGRFESDIALGGATDVALEELVDELQSRDLQLIAQATVTSQETGSDITCIMDTIGEAVRERAAIKRELDSQTVQGRLSGRIVAALPLIFLGISAIVSRSTVSVLVGTTPGLIILAVAVVMNVLGFLWIRKILDIEG